MPALDEVPLLDAALIVKNEEFHLSACLEALGSLRPLLGRICVYDTGSSDRTVEICEAAGCHVERGYWDDDFARARNVAASMCEAPWVLHVDADEVTVANVGKLRDVLERGLDLVDVLYFSIRSWDEGRLLGDAQIGRLTRRVTTRFIGKVHEHAAGQGGTRVRQAVVPSDILMMHHVGYSGQGTLARKSARNAAISDREVALCRNPGVPESELQLALIHRARALAGLDDWEGAIRDLREVRDMDQHLPTRRYAGELLVEKALERGDHIEATDLLESLSSEGSDREWIRWKLACLLGEQGQYKAAWGLMQRVDTVVGGLGESISPASILRDRLMLALKAEAMSDAVATALLLVGTHGRTDFLPLLVAAWSHRPPAVLAQLLWDQGDAFAERIEEALASDGPEGAIRQAYSDLSQSRAVKC